MINVSVSPKGIYCYEGVSVQMDSEIGFRYKINSCPFYVYIDGLDGKCSAFNLEITDQVKECNINDDVETEELEMCDNCHEFPTTVKCLVCKISMCDECADEHDKVAVYDEAHTGRT